MGNLDSACTHWILTCKEKESSLEVKSSDWPYMESSCVYTSSAYNWGALGALDLKGTFFLETQASSMSIPMTRHSLVFLHWALVI